MSEQFTFGSVCSGIEAASCAFNPLGWKALWFSEVESFPCALLAARYPDVPNLGDMAALEDHEYVRSHTPDALVGGTPCQGFSIAGLRRGLADDRSNLALAFVRLALRLRWQGTRWFLWENVPGVLTASKGQDFCYFLSGLAGVDLSVPPEGWGNSGLLVGADGYFSLAWRVSDAQYAGVPQRRRRLFVVGHSRDWRRAAAVFFDGHSVSGDPPPRRQAGQGSTCDIAPRIGAGGRSKGWEDDHLAFGGNNTGEPIDVAPTLLAGRRFNFECETFVAHTLRGEGFDASEDGTGRGIPLVPCCPAAAHTTGAGYWKEGLGTLRGRPQDSHENLVAFAQNSRDEVRLLGGDGLVAGALAAQPGMKQQTYVAFSCKDHGADLGEVSPTLRSMGHDGSHANAGGQVAVVIPIHDKATRYAGHPKSRADADGSGNGLGVGDADGVMYTLTSGDKHAVCTPSAIALATEQTPKASEDRAFTLTKGSPNGGGQPQAVAYGVRIHGTNGTQRVASMTDVASSLMARRPSGVENSTTTAVVHSICLGSDPIHAQNVAMPLTTRHGDPGVVQQYMVVRRLTPLECERLQGFPDNYTRIAWSRTWRELDETESVEELQRLGLEVRQGKSGWQVRDPDGPRYKALGNSWAVPDVRAIGRRIQIVDGMADIDLVFAQGVVECL